MIGMHSSTDWQFLSSQTSNDWTESRAEALLKLRVPSDFIPHQALQQYDSGLLGYSDPLPRMHGSPMMDSDIWKVSGQTLCMEPLQPGPSPSGRRGRRSSSRPNPKTMRATVSARLAQSKSSFLVKPADGAIRANLNGDFGAGGESDSDALGLSEELPTCDMATDMQVCDVTTGKTGY